jgi:ABC-2 type transport system permease protein
MAIGASANQLKEAQAMLLPIWLLLMIPLFVWLQIVRDPTGEFATWISFIPTATPMVMVLRIGASAAVPWWQPALGIVETLAMTAVCLFAAARIFRIGILAQGKTPKLGQLLRWAIRG